MDLSQWTFWVLPTRVLDEQCPDQKTIGVSTIERLGAEKVGYDGLGDAVVRAIGRTCHQGTEQAFRPDKPRQ
jgi:hypothetical protein